jgi:hypothetical protein
MFLGQPNYTLPESESCAQKVIATEIHVLVTAEPESVMGTLFN